MQTKTCTKCGEEKALTEYHKHKSGKYGVQSKCKRCVKEYMHEYSRRPEVLERQYNYDRSPEKVEKLRLYEKLPERREMKREYNRKSWELGLRRDRHREIVGKYATRKGDLWSDAEIEFLMSSDLPLIDIALELGRAYNAVHLKRTKLRKLQDSQ